MRHCVNETVKVYEATGDNLANLLRDVAETVEKEDGVYTLHVDLETDYIEYRATLFVHG